MMMMRQSGCPFIFLVYNFLLATVSNNYVDEALINFLSYGNLDSYSWGKFAFEQMKNSLSLAVKGHLKKGMNGGVYTIFIRTVIINLIS